MLRHLDEELYAQYGSLCLYGVTDDCLEFRDNVSESYHAYVTVHLEAWDTEPPELGADWRPIERTEFTAVTGVIQMGVVEDGGHDFLIGPPLFEQRRGPGRPHVQRAS
ncbi:hypothetical protein C1J01_03900 [Nonomuraea aridisoli]|uniref:Uncharacterized protein n=2 Tax=Nonomuraea aridisoli TaxID=2070368 RepID=A0A2W2FBW1_9ACTN|nr:hypothetical protein C1J01_03900 [Nonomuraea aridisoli]